MLKPKWHTKFVGDFVTIRQILVVNLDHFPKYSWKKNMFALPPPARHHGWSFKFLHKAQAQRSPTGTARTIGENQEDFAQGLEKGGFSTTTYRHDESTGAPNVRYPNDK